LRQSLRAIDPQVEAWQSFALRASILVASVIASHRRQVEARQSFALRASILVA
jgi:hypothetical protein